MNRKSPSLTMASLVAAALFAATEKPADASCDLFEQQMCCSDMTVMSFCGGSEAFSGMDSDIYLTYCPDGTPVSQCSGGYSCQDPEPIITYDDEWTTISNPPRTVPAHYYFGDRVSYKGRPYKCLEEHNAKKNSNPTQSYSKWERLVTNSVWTLQAVYRRGQVVTYKGRSYAALTNSQAKSGHEPSKDRRLWRKL